MPPNHVVKNTPRIDALDFTKGILVLFMVVYHCLNYLHYGTLPHDYLGFLPSSFIMITGFILTQIYCNRPGYSFVSLGIRVVIRAIKLLFLFTFLNVMAHVGLSKNHLEMTLGIANFFSHWFDIYIIGNAESVAFEILIPISYTLLLSMLILKAESIRPYFIALLAIIVCALCMLMESYGYSSNNLNLISSGFIGMALGLIPLMQINRCARSWLIFFVLIMAYSCFLIFRIDNYFSQTISTAVCLLMIYSIGFRANSGKWWFKHSTLLGQYSLIGYIVQIFYLQITRHGDILLIGGKIMGTVTLIVTITVLTWITVLFVNHARLKYITLNRGYNFIFS